MGHNPHNDDPTAASRKEDHIALAFESVIRNQDKRFYYEPALSGHPGDELFTRSFCGKTMHFPIWVSSMTGGTERASMINKNLAKACGEFGLGMGLGSCRQLLYSDEYLADFNVRPLMPESPLCINLGIAQIEQLIDNQELDRVSSLMDKLDADGLIVHINPLQEWLQPEGDHIQHPPTETIQKLMKALDMPILVKEVGQGMGPKSLAALLAMPLEAVDFGAHGGTNFSKLELHRASEAVQESYDMVSMLGHNAYEMMRFVQQIASSELEIKTKNLIISGGVGNFLDGYFLQSNAPLPSIYGQASAMLKPALQGYEELKNYIESQIEGYRMAHKLLKAKDLSSYISE